MENPAWLWLLAWDNFGGDWVRFAYMGVPVGLQIAGPEKALGAASEPVRSSTGRRIRLPRVVT